jgi:hypothetical protein
LGASAHRWPAFGDKTLERYPDKVVECDGVMIDHTLQVARIKSAQCGSMSSRELDAIEASCGNSAVFCKRLGQDTVNASSSRLLNFAAPN